jgi:hypothetical protein
VILRKEGSHDRPGNSRVRAGGRSPSLAALLVRERVAEARPARLAEHDQADPARQPAWAECLDRLLIIGRRHLESVLRIDTAHYNRERPHCALALLSPDSTNAAHATTGGQIKRRDRLGGLIHEYHRTAA